ncbi:lamin tail domain-containing protein [Neolewinella litorea]|uniref:T9SS type A sorting domain-containing protein n=1 Tax=Neolewinella litorea TaxID=2562452 RepID=A0A4S4NFJ8_9BACT|nr:lamin tail domain-containing protein [Neolewinella litorea]THH37575.1 T9SS type A sorting domain-containing protein [Neolewinella litorea]
MNAHLYPCLLVLLLTASPGTRGRAQDTIARQNFEPVAQPVLTYTTETAPYGSGGIPTWNVVDRIRGIEDAADGTRFWAARDVENTISGAPRSAITFDAGNICSLTSARFVFAYRVVGYDGGDDFGYVLHLDGFPEPEVILIDGRNGGGISTDGWVYDTVAIPGTAQTAALSLFFDQNGDDVAAIDDVQLLATGNQGSCRPICGIRLGEPVVSCESFTPDADELQLRIPYSGGESGVSVTSSTGIIGGDDPASQADGTITLGRLPEGEVHVLRVKGGDCDLTLQLAYPADWCTPSDLVINEVLADPGEDINGDGVINGADEFVEIYNRGTVDHDLGGHTVHEGSNSGARFTFPAGTVLAPNATFLVLAGGGSLNPDCAHGIASGFLGLNNDSPETVTLRDPDGKVIAQFSVEDAPAGESLVLSPDGNLDGGYQLHTAVAGTPSSACVETARLPVVLQSFTATSLHDAVRLDWRTTQETDNEVFVVERSKSGRSFREIGRVPAGNGRYFFVDYAPFPGQNIYRLRQLDTDGQETVFGPRLVRLDSGTVRVYPNPTSGKLFLSGEIEPDAVASVHRPDGRRVLSFRGGAVNVRALPAGVYYLRIRRASSSESFRFIKE